MSRRKEAWTLKQVQDDGLSGPSLLPAEIHRDDVRPVLERLGERMVVLGFLMGLRSALLGLGLELEREIHRRVDEAGDRGEGYHQPGRRLVEAEPDLEAVVADLQVPEAVLDDDGHLVRKALGEMLRDIDPGRGGLEGDVEMMLAGQRAAGLDLPQHPADDGAQRFLDD